MKDVWKNIISTKQQSLWLWLKVAVESTREASSGRLSNEPFLGPLEYTVKYRKLLIIYVSRGVPLHVAGEAARAAGEKRNVV